MAYFNVNTKRDLIKIKKQLKQKTRDERLDHLNYDEEINKIIKPIQKPLENLIEPIKKPLEDIARDNKNIALAIQNTPSNYIVDSSPLAIEDSPPSSTINLGPIAYKYLTKVYAKDYDLTYGIRREEGSSDFMIGHEKIKIDGNNIIYNDVEYPGTEGLWKLLTLKQVGKLGDYAEFDLANYKNLLFATKPFLRSNGNVKWTKADKWKNLIKPIYLDYQKQIAKEITEPIHKVRAEQTRRNSISGSGLIILPSDLNKLISRHKILLGEKKAGNSAVFNEFHAINDELIKREILTLKNVENINLFFNKNED